MKRCTLCRTPLGTDFSDICAECFATLPPVRVASPSGPCLTYYRSVRTNPTTVTLAFQNGSGFTTERVRKGAVHTTPCTSCTDHPTSQYPDGLLD